MPICHKLYGQERFSTECGPPSNVCIWLSSNIPVLLLWSWPWSGDLDIRKWPRYFEDIHIPKNEFSGSRLSKVRARTKQTGATEHITTAALTTGNNTSSASSSVYFSDGWILSWQKYWVGGVDGENMVLRHWVSISGWLKKQGRSEPVKFPPLWFKLW